jgi:hypothetical protein
MKAFIVTVIAPNDWDPADIVISCNIGMQSHAKTQGKDIHSSICTHAKVTESFDLKRQDL